MRYLQMMRRFVALVSEPLRCNAPFFVFMYVLGCICAWATLPDVRGAHLYDNLFPELFIDVYVLALVLTLLPRRVRPWVRGIFYFILYVVALVDVYCFVKFHSSLTPTMLLLVGETDSREAGEFLRSCVSPDILFSNVGWGGVAYVHTSACSVAVALSSLHTEELVSFVQVVARPFRTDA